MDRGYRYYLCTTRSIALFYNVMHRTEYLLASGYDSGCVILTTTFCSKIQGEWRRL